MAFDPTNYKLTAMQNWDTVATSYHSSWASNGIGPFKSTAELVNVADIGPDNRVLDVACGTGAVSAIAMKKLGSSGSLIGIAQFIQMDAEKLGLRGQFDRILCQYALMFFPDSQRVLLSLRELLEKNGKLALAVHGAAKGVPYFSTIMEPVLNVIPDIRPPQTPTVHRFGEQRELQAVLSKAGYSDICITTMMFEYNAGTFEQYWSDYLSTTASSIRKRIEENENNLSLIKKQAFERSLAFTFDGAITFPWDVLIATAEP
jgi:ubiquinone/menaquinone biosynthesis C-methylase UbiE